MTPFLPFAGPEIDEETRKKYWSGIYGFTELRDGQVWAYGGTVHFGSDGFIGRVDRGQGEALYRLDNFRYPSTSDGLQALVTNPGEATAPNWKAQLRKLPMDPWNHPYQYAYPGQHGDFDVFTYGADGQEGGEGINADIGNWDLD